jgi:hypothetical protein
MPNTTGAKRENERCISMLEALDRKGEMLTAADRRLGG